MGSPIAEYSGKAAEQYDKFREYMVKRIDQRKYDMKFFTDFFYTARDMFESGKTVSIPRLILMSGMTQRRFNEARAGQHDHALAEFLYKEGIEEKDAEFIRGMPMYKGVILLPPSELIEKIYLMYEAQITEEMLDAKNMPQVTSRIFMEKSVFGYSDQPSVVNQTNVLNISSESLDLAEKMLK